MDAQKLKCSGGAMVKGEALRLEVRSREHECHVSSLDKKKKSIIKIGVLWVEGKKKKNAK